MKKIFAILMAMILMLSMAAMAQTVALDPADADNATITISNASRGETYSVYKLFDATVTGEDKGSIAYTGTIPSTLEAYFEKDSAGNISVKTGVQDEDLFAALKTWAESATATNSGVNSDGAAMVFTGLPYGYYVVTSTLNSGAAITVTSTNPSATINDKNTTDPITPPDGEDEVDYKKVNDDDVNIGDTVTYTVEFKTATYDGLNKITKYTIADTLPEFLTNVTVTEIKVGDTAIATQQFVNKSMDIAWVDGDGNSLYANGAVLKITYTAVVTEEVAIAGNGNTNTVTITYTTADGTSDPVNDSATIYSYAIAIQKVDDNGEALADATFQLPFYVKATADEDGAYIYAGTAAGDGLVNELTTPDDGLLVIKGLASDTYSITETAAPNGYNKLTAPVSVEAEKLTTTTTNTTFYIGEDGALSETETETSVVVSIDELAASSVVVVNKTGSALPSTGGIGTTIFYVVGGLLMAAAVVLLVTNKKMSVSK